MRKLMAILVAIGMCAIFAPLAGADDSDQAQIAVTLQPQAFAYIHCNRSSITFNTSIGGNTSAPGGEDWANLSNTGSVAVSITVTGDDTENWTIENAPGLNEFEMLVTGPDVVLTTGAQQFIAGLMPPGDGAPQYAHFGLHVYMPTITTHATNQHFDITFAATAI